MELFGPNSIMTLSIFVARFALPLALFLAADRAEPSDLTDAAFIASLAAGLNGTYLLGILLGRFEFGHDMRSSALGDLACSFPNMAYCGPPVLIAAVAQGLVAVIVGNLIVTVLIVPFTTVIMQLAAPPCGGKAESEWLQVERSLLGAVKQPLVWLPILGAVLALLGVHLPAMVDNAVDEIERPQVVLRCLRLESTARTTLIGNVFATTPKLT
jgi:malonate transporter